MQPLIVINFKSYKEACGNKGVKLALEILKLRKQKYKIIVCPTHLTIKEISKEYKNSIKSVFAQHSSQTKSGAHTGAVSLDELKECGVDGTILNHSERKISFKKLEETLRICKLRKMTSIVCASTMSDIKKIATLKPDYIAYEPKSLIGKDISVTSARPDIIIQAIKEIKAITRKTKLLCGAGIHSKEDVGQALILGCHGVLLAHAVVQAKDPKKFLEEMLI